MVPITRSTPTSGQADAETTVTIRIGDVVATQKLQPHFAQRKSGVISLEQRTKWVLIETRGHEEWRQGLEEDWQKHLDTLQKYVRELLLRNQQVRMALLQTSQDGNTVMSSTSRTARGSRSDAESNADAAGAPAAKCNADRAAASGCPRPS